MGRVHLGRGGRGGRDGVKGWAATFDASAGASYRTCSISKLVPASRGLTSDMERSQAQDTYIKCLNRASAFTLEAHSSSEAVMQCKKIETLAIGASKGCGLLGVSAKWWEAPAGTWRTRPRGCAAAHHRTPDCQNPGWTPEAPLHHPHSDGSPTSHPYIVVDQINEYKDDGRRSKPGYSNRALFLEPPAEDADDALERLSLVTGSIPSRKSSVFLSL